MNAPKRLSNIRCRAAFRALFLLLGWCLASAGWALELHSYAFVQDDGTLHIENRTVHLYGIHIPQTGRDCRLFERPVKCAPRAVLALDFKIQGFVRCEVLERHRDRSVTGQCFTDDGEDLSAYLLKHGWAVATPEAPFEYHTLERIAKHQNRGIWGFPVDNLRKGPIVPRGK